MNKTVEFGPTKMFQNAEQKILFEEITRMATVSVPVLMESPAIRKIVSAKDGEDDSVSARKYRLRGRIRILRKRLRSRGSELLSA